MKNLPLTKFFKARMLATCLFSIRIDVEVFVGFDGQ